MEKVASRTWMLDSKLLGIPETTGVYYLDAERPALVETSAAAVSSNVLEGLGAFGIKELAYIVLSHIHLDHAGAAGQLADAFPDATIVVHSAGARHMVDPSRLEASAARVYGQRAMERLWGRLSPVPADRLVQVEDGYRIDLGNRQLEVVYAPGHAKHQIALMDSETRGVFIGDAAGIYLSKHDYQTPSTPPPDLDPNLAIDSLRRVRERNPERIFFTHYGPGDEVDRLLENASEGYARWGEIISERMAQTSDIKALADALRADEEPRRAALPAEVRRRLDRFTPYETAAAGYRRHFEHLGIDR